MAWNLPPLAVTGSTIPAAWGNATRESLLETAPGQVTDQGQIFWASADGEISPLDPPSGTGAGYLSINRATSQLGARGVQHCPDTEPCGQ